jgi:hypothetical protein
MNILAKYKKREREREKLRYTYELKPLRHYVAISLRSYISLNLIATIYMMLMIELVELSVQIKKRRENLEKNKVTDGGGEGRDRWVRERKETETSKIGEETT